jgi:hypothetical protein
MVESNSRLCAFCNLFVFIMRFLFAVEFARLTKAYPPRKTSRPVPHSTPFPEELPV